MALEIGSVIVAADGSVTGSGLSLAIFNGALSGVGETDRAKVAEGMAPFCNGIAAAIINHFVANAEVEVTITPTDGGLQTLPAVSTPGTPTDPPVENKVFTGSLS
jgi:hypothetical protein